MKKETSGAAATSKSRTKNHDIGTNKRARQGDANNGFMRLDLQLEQPLATSDMPPETRDFILAYAQRRLNQTRGCGYE